MIRSISDRKSQEWQRRFTKFHNSRQTIPTFCRQEGVSQQSFYLWRNSIGS